jgi:hypothetical protein
MVKLQKRPMVHMHMYRLLYLNLRLSSGKLSHLSNIYSDCGA